MNSVEVDIQIKATGEGSKIEIQEIQKKVETKPIQQNKNEQSQKQQIIMKLYVYGSCQSDQFRHPNKQSESKRPICLTNIQKFDLNGDEDQPAKSSEQTAANIYVNPLFRKSVYKIACGGLHSVVLTTDGKAYTFGCNDEGALGRKGPECIPIQVQLDTPVDLVSAGDNHTMFANSANGIVFFTGNYNYLRGQKMVESINQPIKFTTVSLDIRNKNHPIQKLVSGANHTCILINHKIFCRGQPQSFTTGRRINQRRKTQNSLTFDGVGLNNVVDVWCGGYHTIAKVKKGKDFVYHTWGKNDQGQLGIGNFKSQAFPVQIKNLRGKNIIKAAAGGFFTIFLTESGQILGCGTNQYGQLGLGEDYEYAPSHPQSQEQQSQKQQKQQQLNQHVQNLKIEQNNINHTLSNGNDKQEVENGRKMQIQCQTPASKEQKVQQKNDMISQSNQKIIEKVGAVNETVVNQSNQNVANQANQHTVNTKNQNIAVTANQNNVIQAQHNSQKKKYQQHNTYIKSARPISFPEEVIPKAMITNISAGSEFSFAWNNITQLYSWGFGMNYVLLTGQQNQQYQPYKVRNKIINDQIIQQIQAGGQHVLYTAFEKTQSKLKPNIVLQQRVRALLGEKNKLGRKRKN